MPYPISYKNSMHSMVLCCNRRDQMIKAIWVWLTHYKVIVQWEDKAFVHYAYTMNEALNWAAQYRLTNTIVLIGIRGKLVAARGEW